MSEEKNYKAGRKPQPTEEPAQKEGQNYLFVIGIDKYHDFPRLYNAKKDAEDFKTLMIERFQFSEDGVFELFDEEATSDKIFSTLEQLRLIIKPEDSLLIYFSGHGEYDKNLEEGFWIPYNGKGEKPWTFIDFSKVKKYIRAIKSLHTFIIADSCYSGTMFSERSKGKQFMPKDFFIPSRYVLTAGRNEVVLDGKPGDNSPFADSLMWHLKNDQGPHISVSELCEKVKTDVSSNVTQIPRYGSVHGIGDRGGMYYFFEKGYTPERPKKKEPLSNNDATRDANNDQPEPVIETPTPPIIRSLSDLAKTLKESIQIRDFEETFAIVHKYLKTDSNAYNDWIFQQGRYSGIVRQQKKGLIDNDFAQRTYNQIADALVYQIDRLKDADVDIPTQLEPEKNGDTEMDSGPFWEKIQELDLESLKRQATTWKEKISYFEEEEPLLTDPNQKFALKKRLEEAKQKYNALIKIIAEKG
jgi:hypothetical protein